MTSQHQPDDMTKQVQVAPAGELPPGQRKLVFVDGRSIVLFNIDGALHAIDNSCPHNGASLANGRLEGSILQCPAHGLRFDLAKSCEPGSASLCLRRFQLREEEGSLMLLVESSTAP
ncbi:Rieske (2Fe-2S) domain-containing protein [Cupriavidus basilensis OR16]|uniref:Rieske (2Fe-2S) domain-containing protein n=1 Tax=Cupriavidus basilensis OR16 TaxID=1127483 RepID=H1SA70_9BURK|nr:Rieske (2Fe-2S) domain-containing protein [Cupriavidus basilensis OR16]